jgi:glycosyltransferase involved in cell wall biosynthesis
VTPTVSVVIPSYRGGPYLREAVASIARQSFDQWETIVVADGLTEDMSDLERDPRVRVIRQRQRGTSIARNVGVASARAALVAFLDDDDRMVGERLHAQVVAMRDENVVLCHSQIRLIDDQGAVYKAGYIRDYQYLDLLRIEGTPHLSASMVRRSVFQEVGGFSPLLRSGEDMDFIFKVAREGPLCFLPEVHTEYRMHANNTWAGQAAVGATSKSGLNLLLDEHLHAAQGRSDLPAVRAAVRAGRRHILPARTQFDLERAGDALTRREYRPAALFMGRAMLRSPVASTLVVRTRLQRDRQNRR